MRRKIIQLYENSVIRYVFFGGCTTLVNLISFYVLRKMQVELQIANVISIILAILFAYVVNSRFVFQYPAQSVMDHLTSFMKFVGARLATMAIEVGGVWLLLEKIGMRDMIGKFFTQFVVLVLNYVFSKFFVFARRKSN